MSETIVNEQPSPSWWRERSVWTMLFLGFSAGIPILLIFGTLSLWLREAGVSRSMATYFSWAILGYSFKFIWAPLVDRMPIFLLTRFLGRRRSWILVSQFAVMSAILLMANTDPRLDLVAMAIAAVCLGFASATQDIVIDAYCIESAPPRLQAMLATTYISGYRIGMIVAGAVALGLADQFGSTMEAYSYTAWQKTYQFMAAAMLLGVITTLVIREPARGQDTHRYSTLNYLGFLLTFVFAIGAFIATLIYSPDAPEKFSGGTQSMFEFGYGALLLLAALTAAGFVALLATRIGMVNKALVMDSYVNPVLDFFKRYRKMAVWVLLLILLYRISDIVLGVISYVFYQDMGYTKTEIGAMSKAWGLGISIFGSFVSGVVTLRIGVMRTLQLAAVLVVATNLLFCWLTFVGQNHTDVAFVLPLIGDVSFPLELAAVIGLDNLMQGFATVAFIAWLSSLTNISFSATQYAIFSSIMTFFPKVIGGYSGTIVDAVGYTQFFLFASALGVPVIFLIHFLRKHLTFNTQSANAS